MLVADVVTATAEVVVLLVEVGMMTAVDVVLVVEVVVEVTVAVVVVEVDLVHDAKTSETMTMRLHRTAQTVLLFIRPPVSNSFSGKS